MSEELKVGDWVEVAEGCWASSFVKKICLIERFNEGYPVVEEHYHIPTYYLRKIDPPIAEEKPEPKTIGDLIKREMEKDSEPSISNDVHITASDLEAINKMEIEAKQYCSCGKWLGRMRINAGLTECMACENKVKQSLISGQSLVESGKKLDGANQAVYRNLTSHLREVK